MVYTFFCIEHIYIHMYIYLTHYIFIFVCYLLVTLTPSNTQWADNIGLAPNLIALVYKFKQSQNNFGLKWYNLANCVNGAVHLTRVLILFDRTL